MKIGIVGAGRMGGTLAVLLAQAGHSVYVANSRSPDSMKSLIAEAGDNSVPTSPDGAALAGDIVILAVPWNEHTRLFDPSQLAGKIVVDTMNSLGGLRTAGIEATTSELLAAEFPEARIVKAFNTMNFKVMRASSGLDADDRPAMYAASDDSEAKKVVMELITTLGFVGLDTGSLRYGARLQQPGGPLFNTNLTATEAQGRLPG